MRQYATGSAVDPITITSAKGVPIRCVAVDPHSKRVAVTSEYVFFSVNYNQYLILFQRNGGESHQFGGHNRYEGVARA